MNQLRTASVTIAASGTVSTIWNTNGVGVMVGIIVPAGWDTANITVKGSMSSVNASNEHPETATNPFPSNPAIGGGTFYDMHDTDDGAIITYTVAAGKYFQCHQQVLANYIALVSTASQSAERVLTIVYRAIE